MHEIAQPQLGTEFTRWESCDFLGVSVEDFGGDWVVQLLRLAFGWPSVWAMISVRHRRATDLIAFSIVVSIAPPYT
jgi:hypothetical protein